MRPPKPIPSVEQLSTIVICDAENGRLIWKARGADQPNSVNPEFCEWWNREMAGRPVAARSLVHGGSKVKLFGQEYYLHRVIFKMVTGEEPYVVDHIDGDRSNNAFSNLRAADDATNMKNKAHYKNNTSGHGGIRLEKGKWAIRLKVNGRSKRFGAFASLDEAVRHRDDVRRSLGFHPNHGRKAA